MYFSDKIREEKTVGTYLCSPEAGPNVQEIYTKLMKRKVVECIHHTIQVEGVGIS